MRAACVSILLLLAGSATAAAQRPSRHEIAGVMEVIVTDYEEGSLALGGRLAWSVTPRYSIDGQVTYGTTLGDGDMGDVLATAGIRANARVGNSIVSLSVRPGVLSCASGDCGMATEKGTFFTVYYGVSVTLSATSRIFVRGDLGDYLQDAHAHGRSGIDHNRTFGIGVGVRM